MRTSGTFQEVYTAARNLSLDLTISHAPMNPVVRREGEVWMLESGLHGGKDADIEIDLDTFDTYFYEQYSSADYYPSDSDVSEFVALCIAWKGEEDT